MMQTVSRHAASNVLHGNGKGALIPVDVCPVHIVPAP